MLINIITLLPTAAIVLYLSFINPHLLPLRTYEIVPVCMQAAFFSFIAVTMFAAKEKTLAIIGMLTSFALLIAGFNANENVDIPFYIARNILFTINLRITCIILGASGAIRCWYNFRKPTEEVGKAETAVEFMNKFFN